MKLCHKFYLLTYLEWIRYGQRLERLDDIMGQFIKQHDVIPRCLTYGTIYYQTSCYFSLPEEIMMMVFNYLSYSEIVTMSTTCRTMAEFVYSNFLPSIVLPLSPYNIEKFGKRRILSLKSSFDIMILNQCSYSEYLTNVKKLNLRKLLKLVFVTFEYRHTDIELRHSVHILPPFYKDILSYYLSQSKMLTHLHIAIDRSERTFNMIDVVADSLPFLYKVVLQSTHTSRTIRNCWCRAIERTKIKETEMVSEDLECDGSLCTFNKLLERLLKNTSIRSLEVLNLSVNQNWELKSSLGFLSRTYYYIMMSSASLQHLRIEQDSFCKIFSIQCPELLELQHLDLNVSPQLNCLLHSDDLFFDGYKTILDCRACPKIERINTIDVKSLRDRLNLHKIDSKNFSEAWECLLEEICPCEFDEKEEGFCNIRGCTRCFP